MQTNTSGQGTIEYLVIIAVIVVISLIAVGLIINMTSSSSEKITASSDKLGSTARSGISVVESVLDVEGESLVKLANNSSDSITLTRINVGGVENSFSETIVGLDSKTFSLSNLTTGCECEDNQKQVKCDFTINYTQNGIEKIISTTKTIECVTRSISNIPSQVVGLGTGTLADPWIINSCLELQDMNKHLDGNYVLDADINCTDTINWNNGLGFDPVGSDTANFTGTFNGNDYNIINLFINRVSENYVGLFGYAGTNARVQDVGLVGSNISGLSFVAALVGYNKGNIDDSFATGNVIGYGLSIGEDAKAGMLVGLNAGGILTHSFSQGYVGVTVGNSTVYRNYVGGLVGYLSSGLINSCYSNARVYGNLYAGGLVGHINSGTISNSYATGNVRINSSSNAGGLVGMALGSITNSYATGQVSSPTTSTKLGGFIGTLSNASVTNSFSVGAVTGATSLTTVKGFIGSSVGGTITNNYWDSFTSTKSSCYYTTADSNTGCTNQLVSSSFYYGESVLTNLGWTDGNWIATATYPKLSWQN